MNYSQINVKDPVLIRKLGIEALINSLGPIGMANFFRQFSLGSGDYTLERKSLFEDKTIDEICDDIYKMQETQNESVN